MADGIPSAADGITYAKEVYAACATVGFSDERVARLKALLDGLDANDGDAAALVAAARAAQSASVAWVTR